MKKILYCVLILGFLASCKDCKPGQKAPAVSFEVDGVYSVRSSLVFKDRTFAYGGICLEIQKPNTAILRFVGLKDVKDVHMKWRKVEEGKYEIDYEDKKAFFYEYIMDRDPKSPEIKYMLTLNTTKPSTNDVDVFTGMSKLFNDTLEDCTSYKREEMNQDPDPGPENNWGKGQ